MLSEVRFTVLGFIKCASLINAQSSSSTAEVIDYPAEPSTPVDLLFAKDFPLAVGFLLGEGSCGSTIAVDLFDCSVDPEHLIPLDPSPTADDQETANPYADIGVGILEMPAGGYPSSNLKAEVEKMEKAKEDCPGLAKINEWMAQLEEMRKRNPPRPFQPNKAESLEIEKRHAIMEQMSGQFLTFTLTPAVKVSDLGLQLPENVNFVTVYINDIPHQVEIVATPVVVPNHTFSLPPLFPLPGASFALPSHEFPQLPTPGPDPDLPSSANLPHPSPCPQLFEGLLDEEFTPLPAPQPPPAESHPSPHLPADVLPSLTGLPNPLQPPPALHSILQLPQPPPAEAHPSPHLPADDLPSLSSLPDPFLSPPSALYNALQLPPPPPAEGHPNPHIPANVFPSLANLPHPFPPPPLYISLLDTQIPPFPSSLHPPHPPTPVPNPHFPVDVRPILATNPLPIPSPPPEEIQLAILELPAGTIALALIEAPPVEESDGEEEVVENGNQNQEDGMSEYSEYDSGYYTEQEDDDEEWEGDPEMAPVPDCERCGKPSDTCPCPFPSPKTDDAIEAESGAKNIRDKVFNDRICPTWKALEERFQLKVEDLYEDSEEDDSGSNVIPADNDTTAVDNVLAVEEEVKITNTVAVAEPKSMLKRSRERIEEEDGVQEDLERQPTRRIRTLADPRPSKRKREEIAKSDEQSPVNVERDRQIKRPRRTASEDSNAVVNKRPVVSAQVSEQHAPASWDNTSPQIMDLD
ncbi:hypothetical protein HDU96_005413 [Phlyctochytrium bullatum]|nr:hypothetical protein HDU96_005413 [Phlyctochytrium bullatum]